MEARIGMVQDNDTVRSIYLTHDAEVEKAGRLLLNYYKDKETVSTLIKRGNVYQLKKYIDRGIFDGESKEDTTIFYVRDMNYSYSLDCNVYNRNYNGFLKSTKEIGAEVAYLYTKDGDWLYIDMKTKKVELLRDKLKELNEEEKRHGK